MPPSFGLSKKMPFTEGVPSLVTSNLHYEISERMEKPSRIKTGIRTTS